jgi:hypothetical protein
MAAAKNGAVACVAVIALNLRRDREFAIDHGVKGRRIRETGGSPHPALPTAACSRDDAAWLIST